MNDQTGEGLLDDHLISDWLDSIKGTNVVVIGDLMIDQYTYGRNDRISPEAPVPVIVKESEEKRLGGAANVALNLNELGANVQMIGVAGNDQESSWLLELLEKAGLSGEYVIKDSSRPTTVKQRVYDGSAQVLRLDHETNDLIDEGVRTQIIEHFQQLAPKTDLVIIQDYDKGVFSRTLIDSILSICKPLSILVAVDPKFKNFGYYRGVRLFKPNLREVEGFLDEKIDPKDPNALTDAYERLKEILDFDTLLITLSSHGVFIADDKERQLVPTPISHIVDVCGAGDTVVAIAALAKFTGLKPLAIAELSNLAGGLVCQYSGVSPIKTDDLLKGRNL